MDSIVQDLRFALRGLVKQPGFASVAIATLALGIGVNSAIFTVVNAVVLEPLRFPEPQQLVRLTADLPGIPAADVGLSPLEMFDYRDRSGIFESISGLYPINANLTEVDTPERVEVMLVSPSYFSLLRVRAEFGRVFGPEDNHPGIAEVVVISDALWTRRFGRAPDILGKKLRIDADWFTVVGVMPPDFRHPGRTLQTDVEMWAPAGYVATPFGAPQRRAYFLAGAVARLKPGLSVSEAQQRLDAFAQQLRAEYPADYPANARWTPKLVPLQEDVVGATRQSLLMLLGAVGIVLLIACANIAGLLLARTAARQRELAVRRALGSGRARLARLLLTESLLLSIAGGAAGLFCAVWSLELLLSLVPSALPRLSEVAINGRVVGFTFAMAVVTGMVFGLAPALQFSNPDVLVALRDGRSSAAGSRRLLRATFVVAEFALAMILLVGAALLVRSFWRLQQVDAGFDGRGVLTAQLWLPQPNDPAAGKYFKHPARLALFDDILRRARELPGVESAAFVQRLPLDGQRGGNSITVDGREHEGREAMPAVQANLASADFFRVMRVAVVDGRGFDDTDTLTGNRVAIVNQELAKRYFEGASPVGRRIHFGGPNATQNAWLTIVGVAANMLSDRLENPVRPMVFMPMTQASSLSMSVALRVKGDPSRLKDPLTQAVRAADPDQPTFAVRTMEEVVAKATASRRFSMQLLGAFAGLALLLAAIGIYGVMAYLVGLRTREIGIRVALGAAPASVVGMIVRYAMRLALMGAAVGVVGAVVAGRLMRDMLFNVSPTDPLTFGAIAGVLLATSLGAAWTPARRAARVDPMVALRGD